MRFYSLFLIGFFVFSLTFQELAKAEVITTSENGKTIYCLLQKKRYKPAKAIKTKKATRYVLIKKLIRKKNKQLRKNPTLANKLKRKINRLKKRFKSAVNICRKVTEEEFRDSDNDGIVDKTDNCIYKANADQEDLDSDNIGDACDDIIDSDRDLVPDDIDNCVFDANPEQLDLDQDNIGDICEDSIMCRTEICSCNNVIHPNLPEDLSDYLHTNIGEILMELNPDDIEDSWFDIYSFFSPSNNESIHNAEAWWNRSSKKRNFDFSGIYNDSPNTGVTNKAGTAISPRHVLYAKHYQHSIGTILKFIALDGTVYERTIIAAKSVADPGYPYQGDITIGYLDQDLPSSIKIYKTLPADYFGKLQLDRAPVIITDRFENAFLNQLAHYDPLVHNDGNAPNNQMPKSLIHVCYDYGPYCHRYLSSGDSGHPGLLPIGNDLVLLFVHTYVSSGSSIPFYIDEINSIMKDLDQANDNRGYHSIGVIDLDLKGQEACRCNC